MQVAFTARERQDILDFALCYGLRGWKKLARRMMNGSYPAILGWDKAILALKDKLGPVLDAYQFTKEERAAFAPA